MKAKNIMSIMLILVLAVGAIGMYYIGSNTYSITGVSQVPIKLDFGKHGSSTENYYIVRANIGARSDSFQIILPKDTEFDLGDGKTIKNSNEVVVKIDPMNPIQRTNLVQGTTIRYINDYNIWTPMGYISPEYYDVQGGMWLTTVKYGVSTYNNNIPITSQSVNIDYQNKQEVQIGDIYIENLGILSNGLDSPSGTYVVAANQAGMYHLYETVYFKDFVDSYNNWIQGTDRSIPSPSVDWTWKSITWNDVWNKGIEMKKIPKDVNTIGEISYIYLGNKPNKIVRTMPIGSYSGEILIYIPQKLANGIIIVKQQSKAIITYAPTITTVDEGVSTRYITKVKNAGSQDYIGVSIKCDNYNVLGNTRVLFNEGEEKTFNFDLTALGTLSDKEVTCKLLADGTALSGGDDERTIYGTIRNVMGKEVGFTPNPVFTSTPSPTVTPNKEKTDTDEFPILYWITGFVGLTAIFTFLNKMRNKERRITDKNLKISASLSAIILGGLYMYWQYTILTNTLGVWLWVAILLVIVLIGTVKSLVPFVNVPILVVIGIVLFIIITQELIAIKDIACSTWLKFVFKTCAKTSFFESIFGV